MSEVFIKDVRISFPQLFEAKPFAGEADGVPYYGGSFLFSKDHPAYAQCQKAIIEVAKAKWKDKTLEVMKAIQEKDKTALHNGDSRTYSGYAGNYFVQTSRGVDDGRPTVVDRKGSPVTAADGLVYGGCYVNAKIQFWAQDNKFGKRVNATLLGVQFVRDGESFSGTPRAARPDEFEDLGDTGETKTASGVKMADNDEEAELARMLA